MNATEDLALSVYQSQETKECLLLKIGVIRTAGMLARNRRRHRITRG